RPEGPEGRAEAEPVGEDEAGEGGGTDRVGEEGQAAHDDPGAEQSGRAGEDQDLEQAALNEGELEGLEHRPRENNENDSSLPLALRCFGRNPLTKRPRGR